MNVLSLTARCFALLAALIMVPAAALGENATDLEKPPNNLEPLPEIAPPPGAKKIDEDATPQVTIRTDGANKIEQYSVNGHVYMIRVTPPIGPPYTIVDPDGSGRMYRGDDHPGVDVQPPRWTLFEF